MPKIVISGVSVKLDDPVTRYSTGTARPIAPAAISLRFEPDDPDAERRFFEWIAKRAAEVAEPRFEQSRAFWRALGGQVPDPTQAGWTEQESLVMVWESGPVHCEAEIFGDRVECYICDRKVDTDDYFEGDAQLAAAWLVEALQHLPAEVKP